ncbi:MAG: alpha/beta fold hydrolase [Planctomycetota bacterium]|nr:alpha/beta fold hydrolase [Planctomycetota bacterium]
MSLDLGYSFYVVAKLNQWEASVAWNSDGTRVGCEAFNLGENSETALLLIHGINESPHAFFKVAPHLAREGFFCRVMRIEGFGETISACSVAKISDWLASVDKEVKQLRKHHRRVVIVAHSLGGAIAINYTLRYPERVDGLVLAAPAVEVSSSRSPLFPVRFWHAGVSRALLFTEIVQSPFGLDALDPSERESERRTPFTSFKTIDQVFELTLQNRGRAPEIKAPVFLCLAKCDRVIDNAAAISFFQGLSNKKNRLEVLQKSAHAILVDYQWKDFSQQTVQFVSGLW